MRHPMLDDYDLVASDPFADVERAADTAADHAIIEDHYRRRGVTPPSTNEILAGLL